MDAAQLGVCAYEVNGCWYFSYSDGMFASLAEHDFGTRVLGEEWGLI